MDSTTLLFLVMFTLFSLVYGIHRYRKQKKEEREIARRDEALEWWDALDNEEKIKHILHYREVEERVDQNRRRENKAAERQQEFFENMRQYERYGRKN